MDCRGTARGSKPGGYSVKTELFVLRKGQKMGVPSLNDIAVDGMLNTTNQFMQLNILSVFMNYQPRQCDVSNKRAFIVDWRLNGIMTIMTFKWHNGTAQNAGESVFNCRQSVALRSESFLLGGGGHLMPLHSDIGLVRTLLTVDMQGLCSIPH